MLELPQVTLKAYVRVPKLQPDSLKSTQDPFPELA